MTRAAGEATAARVGALSVALERLEQNARDTVDDDAAALDRIALAGARFDEALAPLRAQADAREASLVAGRDELAVLTEAARRVRIEMKRAETLAAAVREAAPQGCAAGRDALFAYLDRATLRGAEENTLRVAVGRACLAEGQVELGTALMPASTEPQAELEPGERWALGVVHALADGQCRAADAAWNENDDITGLSAAGLTALEALATRTCRWHFLATDGDSGDGSGSGRGGDGGRSVRSGGGGSLRCNDGTISPGCRCPGWQGCCSHHGGIAGCW